MQVVIVSLFDLRQQAAKALVPLDDLVKCLAKCLHPLSGLSIVCTAITQVLQVVSQLLLENDGIFRDVARVVVLLDVLTVFLLFQCRLEL